jgi:hypothetical protein
VAEAKYTAFTSKKGKAITARLIVRRVKDLNRTAVPGQGELFCAWRYHAIFTDSPFETIQAEEQHRGHAQAEQVFADLAAGPLAHLPSGSFPASAAWLACAARTARHGREHITIHLPEGWHRETEWMNLFQATCGPPAAAA